MKKYYLNPNYKIVIESDHVLLKSSDSKFDAFMSEAHVSNPIHPLQAIIISIIHGKNEFDAIECLSAILSEYNVDYMFFIEQLLGNHKTKSIMYCGYEIMFPKNTILLETELAFEVELYDYESFINIKEVRLDSIRPKIPSTLGINTVFKCYTDCIYCFQDRTNPKGCEVMPIEKIQEIVEEAKALGIVNVETMGGETFLYPYWYELYKVLKDNGYGSMLSTKMPLQEKEIKKLHDLQIKKIQISLDSGIPSSLKAILSVNENYLKAISNSIKLLDNYGIGVEIHTIINKYNCNKEDIDSLSLFLSSLRNIKSWKIDFAYSSFFSKYKYNSVFANREDLNKIRIYIDEIKDQFYFPVHNFDKDDLFANYEDTYDYVTNGAAICPANKSLMNILPNGDVTICEKLYWTEKFIIGNIYDSNIYDVWNGTKAIDLFGFRKKSQVSSSPCSTCESKILCDERIAYCLPNILYKFGPDKWHMPDPQCPKSKTSIGN